MYTLSLHRLQISKVMKIAVTSDAALSAEYCLGKSWEHAADMMRMETLCHV